MFSKLDRLFKKNDFAKSVGTLVGGAGLSQLLLIMAAPLLTRLYTPEDFGLLAVYSALLAMISVVSGMRYELAIPLPERDEEAINLVAISLISVALITGLTGGAVYIVGDEISNALGAPLLSKYFWLLPIGVFLSGSYSTFSYWATRKRYFSSLAKTRVGQVLATLMIQVLGYKLSSLALLFGQALGQGVGVYRLVWLIIKNKAHHDCSIKGMIMVANRYRQFPLYSTWSGLFNSAGSQLPPLLFSMLFNALTAGLYSLASRILSLPLTVVSRALGQVYYSDFSKLNEGGCLAKKIEKEAAFLVKICFPISFFFMLIAPELFAIVFGESWREAGSIARWLTPMIALQFVSSPLSTIYFVLEREKLGVVFQMSMLIFRVGVIFLAFHYFGAIEAVILFSAVSSILYLVYIYSFFIISGASVRFFLYSVSVFFFFFFIFVSLMAATYVFNIWLAFLGSLIGCFLFLYFCFFRN